MDLDYVLYEKAGRVARVTLNRPEVMNALHPPLNAELNRVWQDFMEDDDVWVALLTGAGDRAFCAGSDLKYRVTEAVEETLRNPSRDRRHVLDGCTKPIVGAINGYAVGGGLELALRCDILVAAEGAKLGLPEARRGLLADGGGVVNLARRLPYHTAMSLILTGRFISASEARDMGLVSEVVPADDLMAAADRWMSEILECAPLAVRAAKQVVVDTQDMSVAQAQSAMEDLEAVKQLRASEDYAEGPRAFAEKRKPVWKGR